MGEKPISIKVEKRITTLKNKTTGKYAGKSVTRLITNPQDISVDDYLPPVGEEKLLSEPPQQKLPNLPEKELHIPSSKPDVILPPGEETEPVIQKVLPGFGKKK